MKKVLLIVGASVTGLILLVVGGIATLLFFFGVDPNEAATVNATEEVDVEEMVNESIKSEARNSDFVDINAGRYQEDQYYRFTGEATVVTGTDAGDHFMLNTQEGEGYGVYTVMIMDSGTEVNEGDTVVVYGKVQTNDDTMPLISGTIIDSY